MCSWKFFLYFFFSFLREKAEAEQSAGKSAESTAFVCKRHKREKDKHARGGATGDLFFPPLHLALFWNVEGRGVSGQTDSWIWGRVGGRGKRTNNEPRSKKVKTNSWRANAPSAAVMGWICVRFAWLQTADSALRGGRKRRLIAGKRQLACRFLNVWTTALHYSATRCDGTAGAKWKRCRLEEENTTRVMKGKMLFCFVFRPS